jgi:hypothetical protein
MPSRSKFQRNLGEERKKEREKEKSEKVFEE